MPKICILSSQHLSKNPRVWKEAISLSKQGFEVVILTIWTSAENLIEDYKIIENHKIQYCGVIDLISNGENIAKKLFLKIRRRLSIALKNILNTDSVWILGVSPKRYYKTALTVNADIYIAHVEFGFYIGKLLIKAGKKVGFDFEDWYSKDYLVKERPVALLQKLEYFALQYGVYCSCPSLAMADALRTQYKIEKEIIVIYNGFSLTENKTLLYNHESNNNLIWFSQTIGSGRGLETLIKALELLDIPIILNLIGNCNSKYEEELKSIFPFHKKHQLFIYTTVPHTALLSLLTRNNIGLAIENNFPDNKDKTVSNKILQYVQAGLKILVTNTIGQREVAAYFSDATKIVSVNNPEEWAYGIKSLMNSPKVDKVKQMQIFTEHFSWEAQEKKLLTIIGTVLDN